MFINLNKKFPFLLFLIFLGIFVPLLNNFVFAQDYYQVGRSGGQQKIDRHGVCRIVVNNRADYDIFVPVKTQEEWLAFRNYPPASVALNNCVQCTKGSDCSAGSYCRCSDSTCQPVPICQIRLENGCDTTNVPNNTQASGCSWVCQACQNGFCGAADINTDPGNQCSPGGCATGNCMGGSAQCGYYTSGQGSCPTCQTCVGASGPSCVNVWSGTQVPGCNGTCQQCNGWGSCGIASSFEDPGDRCPSASSWDPSLGCATGYCSGSSASCGYYTSSWQSFYCPTCKTCQGATSPACVNVPNNTVSQGCGQYSWETCQACQNGSCGVASAGTDPGNHCDWGWGNSSGCATGNCMGGSAQCGYYTSGHGNCDICDYCTGAISVACVSMPIDSQDQWGCFFCDGMGNNKHCTWDPYPLVVYPCAGYINGSISCRPSTWRQYGYYGYSPSDCGSMGSYVSCSGWGDSIWYAQCDCW